MEKNSNSAITGLLGNASILLLLNLLASALNYGYQILLARVLSVESFGAMYVIFSLMLIMAVPGNTFTMLSSKEVAVCCDEGRLLDAWGYIRNLTRKVSVFSCGVFLFGLLLYALLRILLKLDDIWVLILTVLSCALGYYHPLFSGCMSGLKRFLFLGGYGLMIPAYKLLGLAAVPLLLHEADKLRLLLLSIVVGSLATAAIGYHYLQKRLSTGGGSRSTPVRYDKTLWLESFLINISFAVYINIDAIMVRHIGGEELSGIYSAASLFGKMLYYCAASVGTVLLPTVATADNSQTAPLLKKTLFIAGGVSVLGLSLLNLLKRPFIQIIYGAKYLPAAEYMGLVSLLSLSIALLTILTNYFVGIAQTHRIKNALLALAVWVLLCMCGFSSVKLALAAIAIGGLICDGYLIVSYFIKQKNGRL